MFRLEILKRVFSDDSLCFWLKLIHGAGFGPQKLNCYLTGPWKNANTIIMFSAQKLKIIAICSTCEETSSRWMRFLQFKTIVVNFGPDCTQIQNAILFPYFTSLHPPKSFALKILLRVYHIRASLVFLYTNIICFPPQEHDQSQLPARHWSEITTTARSRFQERGSLLAAHHLNQNKRKNNRTNS